MSARIPRTVWALGWVSLCMDTSSELIHSLLPIFITTTLAGSATVLGLIEGVAESLAPIVKLLSGRLSDRIGRRFPLILFGYGLAAAVKPMFPLAQSLGAVAAARWLDRVGKGVRGAPRDALIADVTPPARFGAAFGLRQSMDTVGAVLGPLLAMALLWAHPDAIRTALWAAVLPAALSVWVILRWVRDVPRREPRPAPAPLVRFRPTDLPARFWALLALNALLSLPRFSEAFLLLRATDVGAQLMFAPLALVSLSLVYSLSAYPAGRLADRAPRFALLALGMLVLAAADVLLARANTLSAVLAGVGLWGLHLGLTQGVLAACVAASVPAHLRGTGFGLFNLVSGLTLLLASIGAGVLWDHCGGGVLFGIAASIGCIAALAALLFQVFSEKTSVIH